MRTRGKRFKAALSAVAVAAGITLATATSASAYCASPDIKWNATGISIGAASSIPSSWTTALKESAAQWSGRSGANWRITQSGPGVAGPFNAIVSRTSSAPPGYGGAPALVDLKYSGTTISSGHVFMNSSFTWNTAGTMNQSQKQADVRTIYTHELGHQVYLNHPNNCGSMTSAETGASMNVTWTKKWTINSDDLAGLAARK